MPLTSLQVSRDPSASRPHLRVLGPPTPARRNIQPATLMQTQLLFPKATAVLEPCPLQKRSPELCRETPSSPPPPPSSGTGPRTYSPPTAPPEPHCACAAPALHADSRGRGASGCLRAHCLRSTKTGRKDFRRAGTSAVGGGGDLVGEERLRNQLLLVASVVKGSDGCPGSVGGVRGVVRARTHARAHAQPETPPSAWVAVASPGARLYSSRLQLLPALESLNTDY